MSKPLTKFLEVKARRGKGYTGQRPVNCKTVLPFSRLTSSGEPASAWSILLVTHLPHPALPPHSLPLPGMGEVEEQPCMWWLQISITPHPKTAGEMQREEAVRVRVRET